MEHLTHAQEMKSRCLVEGKDLRSFWKTEYLGQIVEDLKFQDRVFGTDLVDREEP